MERLDETRIRVAVIELDLVLRLHARAVVDIGAVAVEGVSGGHCAAKGKKSTEIIEIANPRHGGSSVSQVAVTPLDERTERMERVATKGI